MNESVIFWIMNVGAGGMPHYVQVAPGTMGAMPVYNARPAYHVQATNETQPYSDWHTTAAQELNESK